MTVPPIDVIIIGAGAAGLMCAMRAGQRGKRVLLLDAADRVGAKILISGGGRCNFTNVQAAADCYLSANPHFCKSALQSYTQHDFVKLVEKYHIAYHEKTLGQLFCDLSASEIVDMLLLECQAGDVDIRLNQQVLSISQSDGFTVETKAEIFSAPHLVLATGGLSIPQMGSTDFTHKTAQTFDVPIIPLRPALVPLVFEDQMLDFCRALSGVALEVVVQCGKQSFREQMLFTHRGLSGPAILQISSYWQEGQTLTLNLLPDVDVLPFLIERKASRPRAELKTILAEKLPQRLAQAIAGLHPTLMPMAEIPNKILAQIASTISFWQMIPSGTEGYKKAEVTLGGVDTRALSSKTMEVTKVKGLYIIGEALDVTGWLGGYNLQWAWSSGWAAGSAI